MMHFNAYLVDRKVRHTTIDADSESEARAVAEFEFNVPENDPRVRVEVTYY